MPYLKLFFFGCLIGAFLNATGQLLFGTGGRRFLWAFFCWEAIGWGIVGIVYHLTQK